MRSKADVCLSAPFKLMFFVLVAGRHVQGHGA
jgi:flagellar biosynthesis protein FliP